MRVAAAGDGALPRRLRRAARGLSRSVDWEPRAAIEHRASALLPGLLLARVDGKSPVEYIDDEGEREVVRRTARELLQRPVDELADVRSAWEHHLGARNAAGLD